jgi:hypothetical protein
VKFGVNLMNFGPGAQPDALTQWAMLTETLGYHFRMTSNHLAITPDVQERYPAPFRASRCRRCARACGCV